MKLINICINSLLANKLSAFLNILLIAFSIGTLTILMLASNQLQNKLENNAKGIDAVVGAKGSPLQLILSSVYHVDFPTGNIPLKAAEQLASNPMVKLTVPLALGDNFNGYRIVGTDKGFVKLYDLKLEKGDFWSKNFEATLGADVAKNLKLEVGDTFFGAHGLEDKNDEHKEHRYLVTGILKPMYNVTDQLVLTNLASIWKMHQHEEVYPPLPETGNPMSEPEITSLLVQYKSPFSVILFPKYVNETTNLQAASPAIESTRLFSLIGVGLDTLKWFALIIMAISVVSVFISLLNSLKNREYDLAIMRTLGATKSDIFLIILFEGIILSVTGTILGLLIGHFSVQILASFQESTQTKLTGFIVFPHEEYLLLFGFTIGAFAAIIPASFAYKYNISKILAKG